MQDIIKEILKVEKSRDVKECGMDFAKVTTVSKEYFIKEVLNEYSDLEFIRILMKKTDLRWMNHESTYESDYCFFSVFIIRDMLQYIIDDFKLFSLDGYKVIDLSSNNWDEQLRLRDKILRFCPIIMAQCEFYYENEERYIDLQTLNLLDNIYIYPHSFSIYNYEFLDSTNFILISNSSFKTQKKLDNLCLQILEKLSKKNQDVIDSEKAIYIGISDKLKSSGTLTMEEIRIIDQFLNGEINRIEKENTLLVRSRKLL